MENLFFSVIMKCYDDGTHTIAKSQVFANEKPQNSVESLRDGDLYIDYFDTIEEREIYFNTNK